MKQEGKTYVQTLAQLQPLVNKLDKASDTDVFFGNAKKPQLATNYKGVYNMGTGELAAVVSNHYKIIQHPDIFKAVFKTLKNLNVEVQGLLRNYNDVVFADLIFTSEGTPIKDDAKGIQIGIRVVNSYNKTTSFRLEMFGYRLICENGMTFGSTMGVRQITFHVGEPKTEEMIAETVEKFVAEVINSHSKLQAYVNKCMADSIEWKHLTSILEKLVHIKKHREEIKFRLGDKRKTVTRWELYNAITEYMTHGTSLTRFLTNYLEARSQKVLTTPLVMLKGDKK